MKSSILSGALLGLASLAGASPIAESSSSSSSPAVTARSSNGTCTKLNERKNWAHLSEAEKAEYMRAEKCLMALPSNGNINGSKTRWDDLQWVHIAQSNVIHGVGGFLPWHRLYMRLHEHLLQTECNYTGAQPYWDEQADSTKSVREAVIWGANETSFGSSVDGCVTDGAFANTTLRLDESYGVVNHTEYCLERDFDESYWAWANMTHYETCMAIPDYATAWSCWSKYPHSSAHVAVGGTMYKQSASPGDPVFFLHHTNLDRLWWGWQQQNMTEGLNAMSGRNVPLLSSLVSDGWLYPSADLLDYNGDPGNVTTMNHTLWLVDLLPNATVADMMDLGGERSCATYL